jgi:hypothetical protein
MSTRSVGFFLCAGLAFLCIAGGILLKRVERKRKRKARFSYPLLVFGLVFAIVAIEFWAWPRGS